MYSRHTRLAYQLPVKLFHPINAEGVKLSHRRYFSSTADETLHTHSRFKRERQDSLMYDMSMLFCQSTISKDMCLTCEPLTLSAHIVNVLYKAFIPCLGLIIHRDDESSGSQM